MALSSLLVLSGCENEEAVIERVKTVCPALKNYTRAQMLELAQEFPKLTQNTKLFINDYALMRKQCKELAKLKS